MSVWFDNPGARFRVGTPGSGHVPVVDSGGEQVHAAPLTVPSVPASVAAVRRYAAGVCRSAGLDALSDTATLLVSEVATNALVHGRGDVRVLASAGPGVLRVEVSDENPGLPAPRHANDLDEGGRGLTLLDALATRWGTEGRSDGKTVWFELDC